MVETYRPRTVERLLGDLFRAVNRSIVWHRFGFLLGLANLVALRINLRRFNLHDTETVEPPAPEPGGRDIRATRTVNGAHNDLAQPSMGMAGTRFGRNSPLDRLPADTDKDLLEPNPRSVSLALMTRKEFVPATTLNVLAAAWIQFMVHDWFSHGKNASPSEIDPIHVPIGEGDSFPQKPMIVPRTRPDPTKTDADDGRCPTFVNTETHWWDASQLYGSTAERLATVRRDPSTGQHAPDGKIHLDANGHLPRDKMGDDEIEFTGVNGNWWIGLSVMHTLFAREHNLICKRLKLEHPERDGDWLFEKARLIVAALIAKIHTTEWTPALLNTPTLRFAMRGNWWGALGEDFARAYGRVSESEVLSGIIGGPAEHHGARYAMTEEFVSVYRMHALLPDDFSFRRHGDDAALRAASLVDVAGTSTHRLYDEVPLIDAVYSLATEHPGALALHNFPRTLQNFLRQDSGKPADLCAIDILRDRERGVPRYCELLRILDMKAPRTFLELTGGRAEMAAELEAVYGDVEKVDALIGMLAEPYPEGFAFADSTFRIFIVMASRRLKSDRFYTDDFTAEVYTQAGLDWIAGNSMTTLLLRHFPALAPRLAEVRNAFFPWTRAS